MATTANSSGKAANRQPDTILIWSALLFAAALAWFFTIQDALMMGNMPGTMGMSLPAFIIMWTIMMAAMMLPSLAPVAALYLQILARQSSGLVRCMRTTGFVAGYLLVWALAGLIGYGIAWGINLLLRESPAVMLWTTALILFLCGVYQFTPLKDVCLKHCRSPLGFLFHFGNYNGKLRDLQIGMYHGSFCTGCCAGLMIVMVFAGVMNITWMVAMALIIFIEKIWRYGKEFSRLVGILLMTTGAMLPWHPYLLKDLI